MQPQPSNPVTPKATDQRRSYRTILLLLLLLTVAVWAWRRQRRAIPPDRTDVQLQTRIEVVDHAGAKIRVIYDLPYAYHPGVPPGQMAMDLFIPETARDCPVLVYCHGGGWIGGNKNGIGPKSLYFASRGILVASVNYRLCQAKPGNNGAIDIADAVRYLHREIGSLGGDPNRIFVMGHSAGAHLAALAICDPDLLARDAASAGSVRGAILLDGSAYDVLTLMQSDKAEDFQAFFGTNPDNWTAVSPYHYAVGRKDLPPMMLVHAGQQPARQASAERLADALRSGGSAAKVVDMPNRDHYGVDTSIGEPDDSLTPLIERFIRNNGKLD